MNLNGLNIDLAELSKQLFGSQVSVGTALVAMAVAVLGWTFAKKLVVGFFGIFKGFALSYVVATCLAVCGLGGAGWGFGELVSGPPKDTRESLRPLSNDEIVKLSGNKEINPEVLQQTLAYTKARDEHIASYTVTSLSNDSAVSEERRGANTKTGWTSLLSGFGSMMIGIIMFLVRFNSSTSKP